MHQWLAVCANASTPLLPPGTIAASHTQPNHKPSLPPCSIPTVFDPSLAPAGHHVVHAYTAANEPYSLWQGLQRGSPEYAALKEERSQVLWTALERVIPDIRERTKLKLVGGVPLCSVQLELYVRSKLLVG